MDVWSDPKWEYIRSPEKLTLERLAEKWHKLEGDGCSLQNLKDRSTKEGWVEQRNKFQTEVELKYGRKVQGELVKGRTIRLKKYLALLNKGLQKIHDKGLDNANLDFRTMGEVLRALSQCIDSTGRVEDQIVGSQGMGQELTIVIGEEISDDYSKSVSGLQTDSASSEDAQESGAVQGTDGGDSKREDV